MRTSPSERAGRDPGDRHDLTVECLPSARRRCVPGTGETNAVYKFHVRVKGGPGMVQRCNIFVIALPIHGCSVLGRSLLCGINERLAAGCVWVL